jgi:peptide/nickel transport system permease protein
VFDIIVTTLSFMGQAVPEFWLGIILILIFYATLDNPFSGEPLLPSGGMQTLGTGFDPWDRITHLILPVTMGAVGWVAWYSRFLRSSMLDVIHQDYITTARAKGLKEQTVLYVHALKNAAIPLVTLLALDMPLLFGGALFTETIFSWPGMGRLFFRSALRVDYAVLMGIVMINATLIVGLNLVADVVYAYLDPRIVYD